MYQLVGGDWNHGILWNFMTFHSHHRIDMKIAVGDINGDIGDMGLSYLVGGLKHLDYFSIYWECHHPN